MGAPLKPMGWEQNLLQRHDGGQSPGPEHGISQSSGAPDTETEDFELLSEPEQKLRRTC